MEIKFKTKTHPEVVTANYEVPDKLADLIAKFGESTVESNAKAAIVIGLQAFGRRHIDKTPAEIQTLFDAYHPDARAPGVKKSALEKATGALASMSAEDRAALLAKLQALG